MKGNKDDPMAAFFGKQKKVIEINPSHLLMEGLLAKINENPSSIPADMESDMKMLYDAALLHSGYDLKDPAVFAHRVEDMMRVKYGITPLPEPSLQEEVDEEDLNIPNFSQLAEEQKKKKPSSLEDFMKQRGNADGSSFELPDDFNMDDFKKSMDSYDNEPSVASTEAYDGEKLEL